MPLTNDVNLNSECLTGRKRNHDVMSFSSSSSPSSLDSRTMALSHAIQTPHFEANKRPRLDPSRFEIPAFEDFKEEINDLSEDDKLVKLKEYCHLCISKCNRYKEELKTWGSEKDKFYYWFEGRLKSCESDLFLAQKERASIKTEQQFAILRNELSTLKAQNATLKAQNSELEKSADIVLQNSIKDAQGFIKKIQELESDKRDLKEENKSLSGRINVLTGRIENREDKIQELTSIVEQYAANKAFNNDEMYRMDTSISNLKDMIQKKTAEFKKISAEKTELNSQNLVLQEEVKQLNEKVEDYSQQIQALENEFVRDANLQEAFDNINGLYIQVTLALTQKEEELKQKDSQNLELTNQLENLKSSLELQSQQLNELLPVPSSPESNEDLEGLVNLVTLKKTVSKSNDPRDGEIKALREDIERLQQEIEALQKPKPRQRSSRTSQKGSTSQKITLTF